MENFPQNPEQSLSMASETQVPASTGGKRKVIFGSIGLVLVLMWPIWSLTSSAVTNQRISEGVEQSNQEFQKFQDQFGPTTLGDPRLNEFLKMQEAQRPKPTVWEIILVYFTYYISPGGGFLFGLLGLIKDKGRQKFFGGFSIAGSLLIVFLIRLEMGWMRMV